MNYLIIQSLQIQQNNNNYNNNEFIINLINDIYNNINKNQKSFQKIYI